MSGPQNPRLPILVVDDEEHILLSSDTLLRMSGYDNVICLSDSREVMGRLAETNAEVVLLDLTMPHITGDELLPSISETYPEIPVVIVTGLDLAATAVECMKAGAFDYLVKPVDNTRLLTTVRKAMSHRTLARENAALREGMRAEADPATAALCGIVTISPAMHAVLRYASAVAPSSEPVLIEGETGVGKEHIAKALHAASGREGRLVATNVAGLDETAFSDTLFGHRKGAFTGAEQPRQGLVELAEGGTLMLDEIGDLAPNAQVKLLRFLQEREYMPLGSDQVRHSNARVVAATNRPPEELMESGALRRDLYYRLSTHRIRVPPLRERPEDIPVLVEFFLDEACSDLGRTKPRYPAKLVRLLSSHSFPGNVRELRALIHDAVCRHPGKNLPLGTFRELLAAVPGGKEAGTHPERGGRDAALGGTHVSFGAELPTINEVKSLLIEEALKRTDGNKTAAAKMVGITRQAISKREKRPPAASDRA